MLKQIFSSFKKDTRTLKEILSSTSGSFDFSYDLSKTISDNSYEVDIPVSDAIKNLPNTIFDLKDVDYYA